MRLKYYWGRILSRLYGFKYIKKSFSGLNEDNIIDWLTGYKKNGTYIDIGANNPDSINNTRLFYERGWRGINIEPDKTGYELFCKKRPGDVNLNCGVGTGELDFFEDENPLSFLNTFNQQTGLARGLTSSRKLKLKPLREIFEDNKLETVDFINIDVEEFEDNVLRSNDWTKYGARVICLEGWKYDYLKQFGYKRVFWDGMNCYYKKDKNSKV